MRVFKTQAVRAGFQGRLQADALNHWFVPGPFGREAQGLGEATVDAQVALPYFGVAVDEVELDRAGVAIAGDIGKLEAATLTDSSDHVPARGTIEFLVDCALTQVAARFGLVIAGVGVDFDLGFVQCGADIGGEQIGFFEHFKVRCAGAGLQGQREADRGDAGEARGPAVRLRSRPMLGCMARECDGFPGSHCCPG